MSHPLERLRAAGVPVTVNTDDPALMSTDLVSEYVACSAAFGWSHETVRELARTSIEASFADADIRRRLLDGAAA
jgi:adenosine deaminase